MVLRVDAGIPVLALVQTNKGGNNKLEQCSCIHTDLAIQLAQCISPSFVLQVSKCIRTLFTKGNIAIDLKLLKQKENEINEKNNRIKTFRQHLPIEIVDGMKMLTYVYQNNEEKSTQKKMLFIL